MDEQELQEFDLEDIMREFGGGSDDTEPEVPADEIPEEVPEEPAEEPADEIPEEPAEEIQEEPPEDLEQTVRIDTTAVLHGAPKQAEPIPEEESPVPEQVENEKTEAFSEDWEPEYEQPIAEYVPPQPIVFHPRSRLRELKKKLVEGPERQYYALLEQGVGKLQIAIFLSLMVGLISAAATGLYAFGFVQENRMKLMVFGQFMAMLVSALLGSFQLIDGINDLFKKKFSLNTYMVFTFIACCIDGCFCLMNLRVPCSTVFCIQVFMSLWGSYLQRTTETCRTDTMRSAKLLAGLSEKKNYADGIHGLLRCEGDVDDFMNAYGKEGAPEKILGWYCLGAFGASAVLGIVIGLMNGADMGVQVFATALLASMPATMFITLTRAARQLERKLYKLGVVFESIHLMRYHFHYNL